jgi:hypothetical protein
MRKVRTGGLMRCCLDTLEQHQKNNGDERIGYQLHCRYCRSVMIIAAHGEWEWDKSWDDKIGRNVKKENDE